MYPEDGEDVLLFSTEKMDAAVNRLRNKARKTPGPDEVPNLVWNTILGADPSLLCDLFNKALWERPTLGSGKEPDWR
jgi:hypothetical protein